MSRRIKRYYVDLPDTEVSGDLAEVVRAVDYDNLAVDLGSMTLMYEVRKDESEEVIADLAATNIALKASGAGYEKLKQENLALHEKVSALESSEVCAAAHDNVETCGYCQRDALQSEINRWANNGDWRPGNVMRYEGLIQLSTGGHVVGEFVFASRYDAILSELNDYKWQESRAAKAEGHIVELEAALRYWIPDEYMVAPDHKSAWDKHIELLPAASDRISTPPQREGKST